MGKLLRTCAIIAAIARSMIAQEPQPARITAAYFEQPDGVELTLPWLFAPGDEPGRESPRFDDSKWTVTSPLLDRPAAWPGTGWFRRHLLIAPSLQNRPVALRLTSPGIADLYLDGQLILHDGDAKTPEVPSEHRNAGIVRFDGPRHILAVRYSYPRDARRPDEDIGFRLALGNPAIAPPTPQRRAWTAAVKGAIIALPIFLALLHLALFAFDTRGRENLFYAGEMLACTIILLHDFGNELLPTDALRSIAGHVARGGPTLATMFGILTYYAVRTDRFPRAWRVLVGAGVVILVGSYIASPIEEYGWMVYFVAILIEIVRLEHSGRTVERARTKFFTLTFAIFGLTILLQILINYGVLESVAGVRQVYIFGILASAVGMSLYLARTLGQRRVTEADNERKTHELAQARELQLLMLPRELPPVDGLDVAAATHTATEVGGDYYDVRRDGDGALLLAFGDATGHGLASGTVVAAAKALFHSQPVDAPLSEMLSTSDRTMRAMQLPTLRMCLALARVSRTEVSIASAAMPPVLIHRAATSTIDELGNGSLPLGSRLPVRYDECRTPLARGDTLLFASDGFAELLDPDDRALGYDGVSRAFREASSAANAREVIERLSAVAVGHSGANTQSDDITFVVVRVI